MKILWLINHSKLSFIFRTQIKIFLMKSESFLTLHRQQCKYQIQDPEKTLLTVTGCYEATRILFVHKENKNNDFI